MKPENAIEVRDVKKHFKVYADKGNMLRERLIHFKRNRYEKREILKGISFDVKKGESVGLIGRNGCGKSTTLKLLTRILRPNDGTIEMRGRVCSLIELGAGFHPDMSGRENIYINASIFGIKAREVDRRLNDIIHFSELEEFIDNPVRTYSSGMYMRLAFSVAINVDADILLIDEILAVGDSSFQTKCFNKLKSLKESGTTIVIVSHTLGQVEKLCDRAIWIDNGVIKEEGPARRICKDYLTKMETDRLERAELEYRMHLEEEEAERQKELEAKKVREAAKREEELQAQKREEEKKKNATCRVIAKQCSPEARREGGGQVCFTQVKMLNSNNKECTTFRMGDKMTIVMNYKSEIPGTDVNFVIGITREDWVYCYGTSFQHMEGNHIITNEIGEISITLDKLNLLQGKYYLEVRILDHENQIFDYLISLIRFEIVSEERRKEVGILTMPYTWNTHDNQIYIGELK